MLKGVDLYFKCVNTKLLKHLQESDIDNLPVWERQNFLTDFEQEIKTLVNNVKLSMCYNVFY